MFIKSSSLYIFCGIVSLFIYFGIGQVLTIPRNPLSQFDNIAQHQIIRMQSVSLTPTMIQITDSGVGDTAEIITIVLILTLFLCGKFNVATASYLAIFFTSEFTGRGKAFFNLPRPSQMLVRTGGMSYPSGHASSAFVISFLIIWAATVLINNRAIRWLVIVCAAVYGCAVGSSRLYLNVHWLSDVYGAFLLAFGIVSILVGLSEIITSKVQAHRDAVRSTNTK